MAAVARRAIVVCCGDDHRSHRCVGWCWLSKVQNNAECNQNAQQTSCPPPPRRCVCHSFSVSTPVHRLRLVSFQLALHLIKMRRCRRDLRQSGVTRPRYKSLLISGHRYSVSNPGFYLSQTSSGADRATCRKIEPKALLFQSVRISRQGPYRPRGDARCQTVAGLPVRLTAAAPRETFDRLPPAPRAWAI